MTTKQGEARNKTMAFQSNVTIKSNIYVNRTKLPSDRDFVMNVQGYEALNKVVTTLGSFEADRLLTRVQWDIIENGNPVCSLDKSGVKSWGVVIKNGHRNFVCKCEKKDCHNFEVCSKLPDFRKIERNNDAVETETSEYLPPDFGLIRHLDSDDRTSYSKIIEEPKLQRGPVHITITQQTVDQDTKKERQLDKPGIDKQEQTMDLQSVASPQIAHSSIYRPIEKPEEIINAKINDRIIVNAGPGTGKTYSVIKRLGYILNNNLADPTNILVLCYSRNAVKTIKNRIIAEIENGYMPNESTQLFAGIKTFDSFATYLLSEGELEATINGLDYDKRIETFIQELQKDKTSFEGLEYLIVDEMQDLVGVRARMIKTILEAIDCGFLLLGDMCQSIYDYQIQDETELNSYRYYKWLESKFGTDVKRFELTKNVRQRPDIVSFSNNIRDAILSDEISKQDEALSTCVSTLMRDSNIGNIRQNDDVCSYNPRSTAILCRNNAEVSIISDELFGRGISHVISKSPLHVELVPWIAHILATATDNKIGRTAFIERAVLAGYEDADAKWQTLKTIAADNNLNVLDLKLLLGMLVSGDDLPSEVEYRNNGAITVSTIHRAKGSEYDNVLLLSSDYNQTPNILDEIKVAYVALTRAKEQITFCDIPQYYIKQLDSKRWIATGRAKKSARYYCSNIDIGGYYEDVNLYSFVSGDADEVAERQKYISTLRSGDLLEAWLTDGVYKLHHNGVYIGTLLDTFQYELCDAMVKTNHSPRLPNALTGIYVDKVITIANTRFHDEVPVPYKKSGLWLGVEISGFAKTHWS